MLKLLSVIPTKYLAIGGLLVLFLASAYIYRQGANSVQAKWDKQTLEATIAASKEKDKRNAVSADVDKQHQNNIAKTRVVYKTIIKEVPNHVTKADDLACTIPDGFVFLHDSAAKGAVPDTASGLDGSPSDVELSAVLGTILENYGTYAEISQRLTDLQEWVRQQEKLNSE